MVFDKRISVAEALEAPKMLYMVRFESLSDQDS
jgi:hypothetical protein